MQIGKKREDEANRVIRERIGKARLDRGVTQEELARRIQKSQKNISDLETGRTEISAADLMYIAAQLEKPIRYFLPVNFPEPDISEEEWEVLRDYRRMWKQENRELARKLWRQIADRETEEDLAIQREEAKITREELKKVNWKNPEEARKANERALERIEALRLKTETRKSNERALEGPEANKARAKKKQSQRSK